MGVAYSAAEAFDAPHHRLRVDVMGYGEVVEFTFPPGGGWARSLRYRGETFARVKD